jgi:predicted nucleotidyltransferase
MTPLDQLKLESSAIARICARHHVAELSVFGSTARGNAGPESDIDLLVTFQPNAAVGLVAFNRLRRELEDTLGRRVDLVPKDGLKPIIRNEVLAEAQILYAA